jgi:hypothetical protein
MELHGVLPGSPRQRAASVCKAFAGIHQLPGCPQPPAPCCRIPSPPQHTHTHTTTTLQAAAGPRRCRLPGSRQRRGDAHRAVRDAAVLRGAGGGLPAGLAQESEEAAGLWAWTEEANCRGAGIGGARPPRAACLFSGRVHDRPLKPRLRGVLRSAHPCAPVGAVGAGGGLLLRGARGPFPLAGPGAAPRLPRLLRLSRLPGPQPPCRPGPHAAAAAGAAGRGRCFAEGAPVWGGAAPVGGLLSSRCPSSLSGGLLDRCRPAWSGWRACAGPRAWRRATLR